MATPGTLRDQKRTAGKRCRRQACRYGGRRRIWDPPGPTGQPTRGNQVLRPTRPAAGGGAAPDLLDAVTVAVQARELAGPRGRSAEPEGCDPP
jgi:hypothetical protein